MINGRNNIFRNIYICIVPLFVLLFTWHFNKLCFETNDDYYMMSFLAGFNTGKVTSFTVFGNIIYGCIVSALYKITDIVPWYTIVYLIIIYTSLIVVFDSCLKIMNNKLMSSAILYIWMFFCLYCWYATVLQFTVVPAFAGMAALLLMIKEKNMPTKRVISCRFILFLIFSFIAIIIRNDVGYLFTLALLLYGISLRLICGVKNIKKYIFSGVTIQAIAYIINKIYLKVTGWGDFLIYNAERARWSDYPRLPYEDNPKLFESIGWTKELYDLAKSWFFLDEHINRDAFAFINSNYSLSDVSRITIGDIIQNIINAGVKNIYISVIVLTAIALLLCVLSKTKRNIIFSIIFIATTLFLMVYLAKEGRLINRVLFAIVFLFMIPQFYVIFSDEKIQQYVSKRQNIRHDIYIILCVILLFSFRNQGGLYNNMSCTTREQQVDKEIIESINTYVIEHPNNFYVYDTSLSRVGNVFLTYPNEKPTNLKHWGGWQAYSPIDKAQLEKNGYTEFYPEDFFDDNVYFMTYSQDSWGVENLLLKYMQERFPGCKLELVDLQPYFNVYVFRR